MTPGNLTNKSPASFRDPEGFVFRKEGRIYRQINLSGAENYELLRSSGLYRRLIERKWLIPHKEMDQSDHPQALGVFKVIEPTMLPFISYPYEWCFGQLKDASLLTLGIQLQALEHGMSLKDASAYNVQFSDGAPIFIDTLSFERYVEGTPWVALGQFCRHFLAPLALMKFTDGSLQKLLRADIDGIPLPLASKLLPLRTWLSPTLFFNIHLRAKSRTSHSALERNIAEKGMTKASLVGVLKIVEAYIQDLSWNPKGTVWADYYSITSYSGQSFRQKREIVSYYLGLAAPALVFDLGANTGIFSRLAAEKQIFTLSVDMDPSAVEKNYIQMRKAGEKKLLPLLVDVTNPSPALGWNLTERDSFLGRLSGGMAMMLALIHHLAIANNLPFREIVRMVAAISDWLIIEFIPKEDSQVQKLLSFRKDVFPEYDRAHFEEAFLEAFEIVKSNFISGSQRILYLMKKRVPAPQ